MKKAYPSLYNTILAPFFNEIVSEREKSFLVAAFNGQ